MINNNIYFPLIISCSVQPQVQVALDDSKERLIQYKKSIKDWSESKSFSKIVLVENTGNHILSNAELSNYKNKGVEIEQIVYGPEKNVSERGASWGSARIYENAIKKSYFVRESDYFATTTGRTFVPNVNSLLKEFDKNHNKTYVNRWLHKGYKRFNPGRADLRFVIWNKNFFITKISPCTEKLNDSKNIWIEHVYDEVFDSNRENIQSFSSLPRVVGQAGHQGGYYDGTRYHVWLAKNYLGKLTKSMFY